MRWNLMLLSLIAAFSFHFSSFPPVSAAPPCSEKEQARKSADQLWAEALWQSLPQNEGSIQDVEALFAKALKRAERKAPIYVSLGEFQGGTKRLKELFDRSVDEFVDATAENLAEELTDELEDVEASEREKAVRESDLEQMLNESFGKVARQAWLEESMEDLAAMLSGQSEQSVPYYLAAVSEDPDYLPAWYRLALQADGKLQERAIAELMKRAPKNALPYYLRAAVEMEKDDLKAALETLQEGNAKPVCRHYPTEQPQTFCLTFPDEEELRARDLAGEPIPRSTFVFVLETASVRDDLASHSLLTTLRGMRRTLVEKAKQLKKDGDLNQAKEYLIAVHEMGRSLLEASPRNDNLASLGRAISARPLSLLKEIYKAQENGEKLAELERYDEAQERFGEMSRANVKKLWPDGEKELLSVLRGERDLQKERIRLLEKALRESGLKAEMARSEE